MGRRSLRTPSHWPVRTVRREPAFRRPRRSRYYHHQVDILAPGGAGEASSPIADADLVEARLVERALAIARLALAMAAVFVFLMAPPIPASEIRLSGPCSPFTPGSRPF